MNGQTIGLAIGFGVAASLGLLTTCTISSSPFPERLNDMLGVDVDEVGNLTIQDSELTQEMLSNKE